LCDVGRVAVKHCFKLKFFTFITFNDDYFFMSTVYTKKRDNIIAQISEAAAGNKRDNNSAFGGSTLRKLQWSFLNNFTLLLYWLRNFQHNAQVSL